jgi:hypothetical protein
MNRLYCLLLVLLCCHAADAHHSSAAYDTSTTASVTGTVVGLQWRNPHVLIRIDVEDDDGNTERWTLETAGTTNLVANGWSRDLLANGTHLTAEIRPMRSGGAGGILRWLTLEDGRVLVVDARAPTAADTDRATGISRPAAGIDLPKADWLDRPSDLAAREMASRPDELPLVSEGGLTAAFDPGNMAAQDVRPWDVTGVWRFRRESEWADAHDGAVWDFLPLPKLTPKAQEIYDETWRRRDSGEVYADPTAYCYPPGMPRIMTRVGNWMSFQTPTAIYMVHRFNNDLRTIFIDGRGHVDPNVRIDSYNGDSIGSWEGDTLYVDTVGFGMPNQFVQAGIPIGAKARVQERWRVVNDGMTIQVDFVLTDPENWEGEWRDTKFYDRILGFDIQEANCLPTEDANMPGLAPVEQKP